MDADQMCARELLSSAHMFSAPQYDVQPFLSNSPGVDEIPLSIGVRQLHLIPQYESWHQLSQLQHGDITAQACPLASSEREYMTIHILHVFLVSIKPAIGPPLFRILAEDSWITMEYPRIDADNRAGWKREKANR